MPRRTARVTTLRGNASAARTLAYTPPSLPPAIDLAATGPVGDCNRVDERSPAQVGLAAEVKPEAGTRVLELRARDHAACVNFTISSDEPPARTYRVQFESRRVSGSRPRACLWQEGPDRCAAMSRVDNDREWRVFDDTVEIADGVHGVHLLFYADGGAEQPTVVQFRNVRVGPLASVALLGVPRERPLPRVVARRDAPWKLTVRVKNARGPFLLATSDGFASGWKASVDGVDDSGLRHVKVNGYANGWLVPFRGSYEMTLEYGPERYARAARHLSILAILGLVGWFGLTRLRRFDKRWHAR
jgi:arabinofuranan 3-O-arabinosyltransferase